MHLREGIEAILMQQRHLVAIISKALSPRHLRLLVYEQKMLTLIFVLGKWFHYLIGRSFLIKTKTNHQSLKYLCKQRINNPLQQTWLT